MNPTQAAATPAPLHDIAGPIPIFPYPLWLVIVVALGVLALVGFLIWLMRRKRSVRPLSAQQKAMAEIAALRAEGSAAEPYAFGIRVSDALRTYIRDQYGLDAVTRTSVEFLDVLRDNPAFTDNEKGALSEFLEVVDLLKYARQEAEADTVENLLELAERLIAGGKSKEQQS